MEVREELQRYARQNGLRLNIDSPMIDRMEKTEKRLGRMLCPCQFIPEAADIDTLIPCPCPSSIVDIERMGHCHCGVFQR